MASKRRSCIRTASSPVSYRYHNHDAEENNNALDIKIYKPCRSRNDNNKATAATTTTRTTPLQVRTTTIAKGKVAARIQSLERKKSNLSSSATTKETKTQNKKDLRIHFPEESSKLERIKYIRSHRQLSRKERESLYCSIEEIENMACRNRFEVRYDNQYNKNKKRGGGNSMKASSSSCPTMSRYSGYAEDDDMIEYNGIMYHPVTYAIMMGDGPNAPYIRFYDSKLRLRSQQQQEQQEQG